MKLVQINEARDYHTFFRGVSSYDDLVRSLNGDVKVVGGKKYWTRNVRLAILYSLESPHSINKEKNAFVLEALLNLNDKGLTGDEDAIAIGEVPRIPDTIKSPEYGLEWDNWFNEFWPQLPKNLRKQFVDEYISTDSVDYKWSKFVPVEKNEIRSGKKDGVHLNVVTNTKIGRRGSNKIISAYVFELENNKTHKIVKKYGNGSLNVGDLFSASHDFGG